MRHIYEKHYYTVLICTVGLWTIWVLGASTSLSSWKFMYNCRTSPLGPRFHIHRFSQFQLSNTMVVVQLRSRFQPMGCSIPGFPVLHHLLEFAQSDNHWISDAVQTSHPLLSSSPALIMESFPASGSSQMSQFSASGGQSIRDSASALVLLMNIQGWYPLGLTGLISLQPKGLSRVFSNTIVQNH